MNERPTCGICGKNDAMSVINNIFMCGDCVMKKPINRGVLKWLSGIKQRLKNLLKKQ